MPTIDRARCASRAASALAMVVWLGLSGTGSAAERTSGDEPDRVAFATDVATILVRRCIRCHVPGIEKGGLSLATSAGLIDGGHVVAGDPEGSYLLELVTPAGDDPPAMPEEGDPLPEAEVATLRRWIAEGAVWPADVVLREKSKADASWWSLQPLGDVAPPSPAGLPDGWRGSPVDRFVFEALAEAGLTPNGPADRRTLIRRVTYDLTGLPPTPEEVEAFASDPDPLAYERLVDRLLGSPRYGERWGRHWLDVVRFGESNGFERNVIIDDLWPFRDYVIDAFNADRPYDRLVREHLAGDALGPDDPGVTIGSAYLVAGPYDNVGNRDPVQAAQIRANTLDEIIATTGEAFLGLTIGCARCHDHKFDPIRQADYYAWYATFAGVRHGSRVVATPEARAAHAAAVRPLQARRRDLTKARDDLLAAIRERADAHAAEHESAWTRDRTDRRGTIDRFPPVTATHVRLVSEGQDIAPENTTSFVLDEFEVWSADDEPVNVAAAVNGGVASGESRQVEDFPGAYGPHLAIDGKVGPHFIATAGTFTVALAAPTTIDRVVFSSARGEIRPEHSKFVFVADYRIEVSTDGERWTTVADSHDRRPVSDAHRAKRLLDLETTSAEAGTLARLRRDLAAVDRDLAAIPPLPTAWVGTRAAEDAAGPFTTFVGGSPARPGDPVVPASLSSLAAVTGGYTLGPDVPEADRRVALADWIVRSDNPLTVRVLANRLWQHHFGTGLVETPSDFGYMGGKPSHPGLLDWLAGRIHREGWELKPIHRLIVTSQAYRQSSADREAARRVDSDARLLWRFPPRRLSAEEVRDTILAVAGALDTRMGGPGFRLYRYLQDNVSTYVPLDEVGPETYRRAVYHQNARAAVVDLMAEFDQPDCAFSTPTRAQTTTPLQALTLLNHDFTLDMAGRLAERATAEAGPDVDARVRRAYGLCFGREPTPAEVDACRALAAEHGLTALTRVLLNTTELITVR